MELIEWDETFCLNCDQVNYLATATDSDWITMTCPHSTHLHIHFSGGDTYVYADQYKVLPIHPYPTPTPKTSLGIYNTSPVGEWTINAATCGSRLHALQSLIYGSCNCLLVCCMCIPKHSKIQLLQWCRTHLDQLKQKHASLVCMAPPCCSSGQSRDLIFNLIVL